MSDVVEALREIERTGVSLERSADRLTTGNVAHDRIDMRNGARNIQELARAALASLAWRDKDATALCPMSQDETTGRPGWWWAVDPDLWRESDGPRPVYVDWGGYIWDGNTEYRPGHFGTLARFAPVAPPPEDQP